MRAEEVLLSSSRKISKISADSILEHGESIGFRKRCFLFLADFFFYLLVVSHFFFVVC